MFFTILLTSLFLILKVPSSVNLSTNKICDGPLDIERNTMLELTKATASVKDNSEHQDQIGCIWKNKGLVNDEGLLLEDNFKQAMVRELQTEYPLKVAEQKADEVVKKCKDANGKNAGETSVKVLRCIGNWKMQSFLDNERRF